MRYVNGALHMDYQLKQRIINDGVVKWLRPQSAKLFDLKRHEFESHRHLQQGHSAGDRTYGMRESVARPALAAGIWFHSSVGQNLRLITGLSSVQVGVEPPYARIAQSVERRIYAPFGTRLVRGSGFES